MSLEDKISALKNKIAVYEVNEILKLIAGGLLQISMRNESPLLTGLYSPQRQLFYLASLRLSCKQEGDKFQPTQEEWEEIKQLLTDIEMSYFYSIGFPKNGEVSKDEIEKIKIALPTFMNYYFNGSLSYQEQQIEQIERIYKPFSKYIENELKVSLNDLIEFYYILNDQLNYNLNQAIHFFNPEKWQEFTEDCIKKGFNDPKDWIELAPRQLKLGMEFIQNAGNILLIKTIEGIKSNFSKDKLNLIFDIFTAKLNHTNQNLYYTEEHQLSNYPFWKVGPDEYLVFYIRQYLEALNNKLKVTVKGEKEIEYLESRDKFAEIKTTECLAKFFGDEANIYSNYGINDLKFEQDILVIYKSIAIIIEVKSGTYRAPMRDPFKAYNKIKSDFKSIIANGLIQTERVSKILLSNIELKLIAPNKSVLGVINCDDIKRVYSLVLTKERFGHIQANLSEMIDNIEAYENPLSMCFEDFEVMLLSLIQTPSPIQNLISYLDSRPHYHGHLICGDEMELFGYFLDNREDYYKNALAQETLVTQIDNTDPIEEIYSNGMGFKNEVNIEKKKDENTGILFKKY